jgi:hypothetical protein
VGNDLYIEDSLITCGVFESSTEPPRTNLNDRGFEIGLGARNLLRESILKVRLVWASKRHRMASDEPL